MGGRKVVWSITFACFIFLLFFSRTAFRPVVICHESWGIIKVLSWLTTLSRQANHVASPRPLTPRQAASHPNPWAAPAIWLKKEAQPCGGGLPKVGSYLLSNRIPDYEMCLLVVGKKPPPKKKLGKYSSCMISRVSLFSYPLLLLFAA